MPEGVGGSPGRWRSALGLLAAAGLLVGAYWSLRLAYAGHLGGRPSAQAVVRAIRLSPGDARLYRRWAALDSNHRATALHAALALNPRDATSWIELGLAAEGRGEFWEAERCLLEAARVDRTLEPRWALANYYFRRDELDHFWRWAREAAAMTSGDLVPLLRLCWRAAPEPELIVERVLGGQAGRLRQFLSFLLVQNHLEGAARVAERIVNLPGAELLPELLDCCDRLLGASRSELALPLWNALASRRLIGYPPLSAENGRLLTNGDFSAQPLGQGFDWRIGAVPGVTTARSERPRALRVSFSGRQPESCELVSQFVPLRPGVSYRLTANYRTVGIAPGSGLEWHLAGARSAALASEEWKEEAVEFAAPPGGLARLALVYRRAPGTMRLEGTLWLRQVRLSQK